MLPVMFNYCYSLTPPNNTSHGPPSNLWACPLHWVPLHLTTLSHMGTLQHPHHNVPHRAPTLPLMGTRTTCLAAPHGCPTTSQHYPRWAPRHLAMLPCMDTPPPHTTPPSNPFPLITSQPGPPFNLMELSLIAPFLPIDTDLLGKFSISRPYPARISITPPLTTLPHMGATPPYYPAPHGCPFTSLPCLGFCSPRDPSLHEDLST